MIYRTIRYHIELVIKDNRLTVPQMGFRKGFEIDLVRITNIETIEVNRQVFLNVVWHEGKYDFLKARFDSKEEFEAFTSYLVTTVAL